MVVSIAVSNRGRAANSPDGTAQREVFRRYLTMTVRSLAVMLEEELTAKLEADLRLNFDGL